MSFTSDSLAAPECLVAETRGEFRRVALDHLEVLVAAGAREFLIDMSATLEMDAHGLGVLVLVQKRARERSLDTRLANCSQAVRHLLVVTRLDFLFRFVD